MKFNFIYMLILIGSMSGMTLGQTNSKQTSAEYSQLLLPLASESVNCETAVRYIDLALNKTHKNESTLIVLIKMKNLKSLKLGRTRLDNIKKYIRFRGFKKFEIALSPDANETEQIELYVQGELLYSLPIKDKDKLDFSPCVVGPKI